MCDHPAWLQIFGVSQLSLSTSFRLDSINRGITDPDKQYPSTVLFLGRRSKDKALKYIFSHNNISRRARESSFVDLHIDNSTAISKYPIYFAESDPLLATQTPRPVSTCHQTENYAITWAQARQQPNLRAVLYSRLLFLFCDVICIFAEDFNGLADVKLLLSSWIYQGTASKQPISTLPRVLIIHPSDGPADVIRVEDLMPDLVEETPYNAKESFFSVEIVHLPRTSLSPEGRFRALRELILSRMHQTRIQKLKERCHLSAAHIAALFNQRVIEIASNRTKNFDLIQASRQGHELNINHKKFLTIFLKACLQRKIPYHEITSFVASSIIMNAFPPQMHKFDPGKIFQSLYLTSCSDALGESCDSNRFAKYLCAILRDQFKEFFKKIEAGQTAAYVRESNVSRHWRLWETVKTNKVCLWCLNSKPEHVLKCEHSICDGCVRVYGILQCRMEHCYRVEHCILCNASTDLIVYLKPPTAGVRMLSIDGGGVRGIVPLQILDILQNILGQDCRIQDLIDSAIGTSAGGLIVLGLFTQQFQVARCVEIFRGMTKQIFRRKRSVSPSVVNQFLHYFKGMINDGCYDTENLESVLRESFGGFSKLFGHPRNGVSRSKVAVAATSISDADTFLFTNYNGDGKRELDCGYKLWRPSFEEEPEIWEAARATSAAPMFFQPARLSGGTFQDGSLKHNNPINLAQWEARHIWTDDTPCDVVLSLGTGSDQPNEQESPRAPHFRHILNDGCLPRTWRGFLSLIHGQRIWGAFKNGLGKDVRADFFRFNIELKGKEPEIDDVGCVDELTKCVKDQFIDSKSLHGIAIALLVSCFYFELDHYPVFKDGFWYCEGTIRCRNSCRPVIDALKRLVPEQMALMLSTQAPQPIELENYVCEACDRFNLPVSFMVQVLKEDITMDLVLGTEGKRKLSGFPQSMDWFIKQQRLKPKPAQQVDGQKNRTACDTCDPVAGHPCLLGRKRKQINPKGPDSKRKRVSWF